MVEVDFDVKTIQQMKQSCEKMIETIQKNGKNPVALSEWCSSHHDDLMKLVP